LKKVIISVSFDKVRKLELPEIVDTVLALVEKYDAATLHIEGFYNLLKVEKSNVDNLSVVYNEQTLKDERDGLFLLREKVLKSVLEKSNSTTNISSLSAHSAVVNAEVNSFFKRIKTENRSAKSELISQFIAKAENDVLLKAALDACGMTVYINELKTIEQSVLLNKGKLTEVLSERVINDRKKVRKVAITALTNLLNAIELARVEHSNVDYMPLVNELNKSLVYFRSLIKSRETRSKTVAEKTKTAETSATTTAAI